MDSKKLRPSAFALYLVLLHIMVDQTEDKFPHEELCYPSGSISFGRYETEPLLWERRSSFSHNKYLEEAEQCASTGSVHQRKAFFEVFFKKKALLKQLASQNVDGLESPTIEMAKSDHLSCIDEHEITGNSYPISNHTNNTVVCVGAKVESNITNTESMLIHDCKHEKPGVPIESRAECTSRSIEIASEQKHFNHPDKSLAQSGRDKFLEKSLPKDQNGHTKLLKESTNAEVNKVRKSITLVPTSTKERHNTKPGTEKSMKSVPQRSGNIKKPETLSQTTKKISSVARGSVVRSPGTLQKKSLPNEKQSVKKVSTTSSSQLKSLKAKVQGTIEAKQGRQAISKSVEVEKKSSTSLQASSLQKAKSRADQPVTRPNAILSSKEKSFPSSARTPERKSDTAEGKIRKDATKAAEKPLQKVSGLKPQLVQERRISQAAIKSHKTVPERSGGIKVVEPIKSQNKSSAPANRVPVAANRTKPSNSPNKRPVSSTVQRQTPDKTKRSNTPKKTKERQTPQVVKPATSLQGNKSLDTPMKLDPLRKIIKRSPLKPLKSPGPERNVSPQEKSTSVKPSKVSGIVNALSRKLPVKSSSSSVKSVDAHSQLPKKELADPVKSQMKPFSPGRKGKSADGVAQREAVKLKSPLRGSLPSKVQELTTKSAKIGAALKKCIDTIKPSLSSRKTVAKSTQTEPVKSIGRSSTPSKVQIGEKKDQIVQRSEGVKKKEVTGNTILSGKKVAESRGVVKMVQPESRKIVGKAATSSSAVVKKARGGVCGILDMPRLVQIAS